MYSAIATQPGLFTFQNEALVAGSDKAFLNGLDPVRVGQPLFNSMAPILPKGSPFVKPLNHVMYNVYQNKNIQFDETVKKYSSCTHTGSVAP